MVPSQNTLEDGKLVYHVDTMVTTGDFRADLVSVGDVRKAEQLATDRDFTGKVSTGFSSNVVDERAAINEIVISEH